MHILRVFMQFYSNKTCLNCSLPVCLKIIGPNCKYVLLQKILCTGPWVSQCFRFYISNVSFSCLNTTPQF